MNDLNHHHVSRTPHRKIPQIVFFFGGILTRVLRGKERK